MKRLGKFKVKFENLRGTRSGEFYNTVDALQLDTIRFERCLDEPCIFCIGESLVFDEVPDGVPIPEYRVTLTMDGVLLRVEAVRV